MLLLLLFSLALPQKDTSVSGLQRTQDADMPKQLRSSRERDRPVQPCQEGKRAVLVSERHAPLRSSDTGVPDLLTHHLPCRPFIRIHMFKEMPDGLSSRCPPAMPSILFFCLLPKVPEIFKRKPQAQLETGAGTSVRDRLIPLCFTLQEALSPEPRTCVSSHLQDTSTWLPSVFFWLSVFKLDLTILSLYSHLNLVRSCANDNEHLRSPCSMLRSLWSSHADFPVPLWVTYSDEYHGWRVRRLRLTEIKYVARLRA